MFLDDFAEFAASAKRARVYPAIREISGPSSDPFVNINGQQLLSFSSNNYLGLAQNNELKAAAKRGIDEYGVGPASARLMSGNLDVYERLEKRTAEFLGYEDAIVFSSGYMANVGTISALVAPPYAGMFPFFERSHPVSIISDELNHASIIDGCRLSKGAKLIFRHNDCDDLLRVLKENPHGNKLIIVDGVYSMDGDLAPLGKIIELAREYDAAVMVDDAHGTGVLGEEGKGTFEHFGLEPHDVDILMGTYVKAFGSVGGFVCARAGLIDYLKVSARSYVFSVCVPPSCAEATIKAIDLIEANPEIRAELWNNTYYLRSKLQELGFNTLQSETPIVPLLVGDEEEGIRLESELCRQGILAPCIRWPAVEKGKSRLRLSLMATHTEVQIDCLLGALKGLMKVEKSSTG